MQRGRLRPWLAAGVLWLGVFLQAPAATTQPGDDWHAFLASGQLVEVSKAAPDVRIDLRYAGTHNCVGEPIYPADFPCLVRPVIARRLSYAQHLLQPRGYGLKIWDGYRPVAAQHAIWSHFSRLGFVADPDDGRGSLHSWGLAVDVTLVDASGHDVAMPSDFDVFAPVASGIYRGSNAEVRRNLHLLQLAMKESGFIGLSTEWWHFAARDWQQFSPLSPAPAGQEQTAVKPNAP
jgi:D-alanyl-D-alanine dipeptidase